MQNNYQNHSPEVQLTLVSTTDSESKSKLIPKPETIGPKSTDPRAKGDYWEKEVSRQCHLRGYGSFQNDYSTGDVDIVIGIDNEYYPFDVKQDRWDYKCGCWKAGPTCLIPDGIWAICVNPETGKIRWPYHYNTKRVNCPPGWEDVWD
jgi:hypothetical protein